MTRLRALRPAALAARLATAGARRSLFFNRLWIAGAGLGAAIGIAAGNPALTWIGALVLVAAAVSAGWNRYALAGLSWELAVSAERVFPGDELTLTLTATNAKPLPVAALTAETELAAGLLPAGGEPVRTIGNRHTIRKQTRLGPYERVTWRLPLRAAGRGIHRIGPAELRASDPLGFFAVKRVVPALHEVIVYPRLRPVPAFDPAVRVATGTLRAPNHLLADPLRVVGIRDYRPGDPMKAIHWKATARTGSLHVRVLEPTVARQLAIFANIDTFNHYWEGLDTDLAEEVIEIAASLALAALERGWSVGLQANGIVASYDQPLRIGIARGPEQRLRLLDGLARISPFSTIGFPRLLTGSVRRLQPGTTVCLVTSLLPDGLPARIAGLVAGGHQPLLVPVGDCPAPAIRGLTVRTPASFFGPPAPAPAEPETAHG